MRPGRLVVTDIAFQRPSTIGGNVAVSVADDQFLLRRRRQRGELLERRQRQRNSMELPGIELVRWKNLGKQLIQSL